MQTKNKAHDAAIYNFQGGEQILIDANVWLYLAPPAAQPTPYNAKTYTKVYANLLQANAVPLVDTVVLSEYCNRYLRLEYGAINKSTYPTFKLFRQSPAGQIILQAAVAEMHNILRISNIRDTALVNIDLPGVLQAVQNGSLDFNDGVLLENCRLHGWKLLTNDSDMMLGGIDVLTTNGKLLAACP
jgi:predicted nucleic acid-binding protein